MAAMYLSLLCLILQTILFEFTASEKQCGPNESCILINDCPEMYQLVQKDPRTKEEDEMLVKAQCGSSEMMARICCKMDVSINMDLITKFGDKKSERLTATQSKSETLSRTLANKPCTTPNNTLGECIDLTQCHELNKIIKNRPISNENVTYLRKSQCGFNGRMPKVCCPIKNQTTIAVDMTHRFGNSKCETPDNLVGKCISIKQCSYLLDILKHPPVSQANVEFLRKSQCEKGTTPPKVCCAINRPEVTTENSLDNDPNSDVILSHPLLPPPHECGNQMGNSRVVGGTRTSIDEFPWLALLGYRTRTNKTKYACGGSLINNRYVITAAHCGTGKIPEQVGTLYTVRLGEYDLQTDPDCVVNEGCNDGATIDIPVERIFVHEGYNESRANKEHDIALIRLAQDVTYNDFVRPICLPTKKYNINVNTKLIVSGWGRIDTYYNRFDSVKRKVQVPQVATDTCQNFYRRKNSTFTLNDRIQFCAGEPGKDSCSGDSGSAAMYPHVNEDAGNIQWILVGVVSLGYVYCGVAGSAGIYTNVSSHTNWIIYKLTIMQP